MNMSGWVLHHEKNIRPLNLQAEGASAGFHIRGVDHLIGLTPFCVLMAFWLLLMLL